MGNLVNGEPRKFKPKEGETQVWGREMRIGEVMKVEGAVGNLVNGEPRKFKPKEVGNQVWGREVRIGMT